MLEVRDVSPEMLKVVGVVDLASVADLREQMIAFLDRAVGAGLPELSVDLSEAELVDAAGLGVLLGAHRRARRGGIRLRLIRITPELQHVLLVSRLYRVLDIDNHDIESRDAGLRDGTVADHGAPANAVPEPRVDTAERRLTSS